MPDKKTEKVTSAADFFALYLPEEGSRLDQNPLAEGIQPPKNMSLSEISDLYFRLPASERYAIFRRLENGGDTETLNRFSSLPALDSEAGVLARLEERIANVSPWDPRKIWEARLAVEEELFHINQILGKKAFTFSSARTTGSKTFELLVADRDRTYEALKKIYASHARALWDTDRDFDPGASLRVRESAFDPQDALPLDPACSYDADRDSVCDLYDSNDKDRNAWIGAKGAKKFTQENGRTVLEKTLTVAADAKSHRDVVEKKFLTPKFLRGLETRIGAAFDKSLPKSPFALKLHFQAVDDASKADIRFTDGDIRDYAGYWDQATLTEKGVPTALHEVGHWFGFRDYYYEALVHGGLRDFMTRPGYGVIAEKHIMASVPWGSFSLPEITNLYARLLNDRDDPSKVSLVDVSSARKSAMRLDAFRLKQAFAAQEKRNYARASKIFLDLLSRHSEDTALTSKILSSLIEMGKVPWPHATSFRSGQSTEEVLRAYEIALSRDPAEVDLHLAYALTLLQSGRTREGVKALQNLVSVHTYYRGKGLKIEEPMEALVLRVGRVLQQAGLFDGIQEISGLGLRFDPLVSQDQKIFFDELQSTDPASLIPRTEYELSAWAAPQAFHLSLETLYLPPRSFGGKIAADFSWRVHWGGLEAHAGADFAHFTDDADPQIELRAGLSRDLFRYGRWEIEMNATLGARFAGSLEDIAAPEIFLAYGGTLDRQLTSRMSLGVSIFLENSLENPAMPRLGSSLQLAYGWD